MAATLIDRHAAFEFETHVANDKGQNLTPLASNTFDIQIADQTKREKHLAAFPKENPNPVLESDTEGNVLYANPATQNIINQMDIENIADILPPNHTDIVKPCLACGQSIQEVEVTVQNRVFAWSYHPIAAKNVVHIYGSDITEHKKAEVALQESQERAHQQARLAAVGQLAAGIAHDFNNLLMVMMGTSQLLELRPDVPQEIKEDLSKITTQGERAAQLVRQILDFSRQTVAQRKPVDLGLFIKETVKLLERTLPENIQLNSQLPQSELITEADLTQLQQVITNLAVNAQHAMVDGGTLDIDLSSLQILQSKKAPLPDMKPGHWIVWRISDTGTGIAKENLEHIFEPFFTTKDPGKGTGLGLAQVYGIVKQHGGEIEVQSEVGQGTTFTIYLPQIGKTAALDSPSDTTVPRGLGQTALVVEDQTEVREIAQNMLEGLGYSTLTASNGAEALDVYEIFQDEIALILTDMVMPEMGGKELVEALKDKAAEIPIVVMSGYPLGENGEPSLLEGTAGYLEKPLILERVAQVVNQVLDVDRAA